MFHDSADAILRESESLGVDYCDIRIEQKSGTSLEVRNSELKEAIPGSKVGAGIRVLVNGAWGFYSTNDMQQKSLMTALQEAYYLARGRSRQMKDADKVHLAPVNIENIDITWAPKIDPVDIDISDKFELIRDMDNAIRDLPHMQSVTTGYNDLRLSKFFFSSEGTAISSTVTRSVAQANIVAKKDSRIIGYRVRVGAQRGWELFSMENPIEKGIEGANSAVRILDAKASPSGRIPVIADNDLTGVLMHEALGHAAESDLVLSGDSILAGRIGEMLAPDTVTIVDDSTLEGGFGSFPFDDEGVPGQRRVLIEKGRLNQFMTNRENAYKLGMEPNGSARAESYNYRPLVRMSNTMLIGGDHAHDELFEQVDYGIYAKGTRGGQVDTAKGSFMFNAQEAFLIEKGEITVPLRDVSISGLTLETLNNITAIGKDEQFGSPGYCGKGQMVPVGDGGPHVLILNAIVGGGE